MSSVLLFWHFIWSVVQQGYFDDSFYYSCPGLQEVTAFSYFPASSPPETLSGSKYDKINLDETPADVY